MTVAPVLPASRALREAFHHVLVPLLLAAPAAHALANDAITAANNTIGLAIGGQNIAYHESAEGAWLNVPSTTGTGSAALPDGYLDSQIGTMPALSLSASRQGELFGIPDVFTALNVTGAMGTTTYIGSKYTKHCNGVPGTSWYCSSAWTSLDPHTERDREIMIDVLTKVGKSFPIGARAQITPYLAFGGRWWNQNVGDYHPLYRWNLITGPGVLAQVAVTSKLVLSLDLAVLETFGAHTQANEVDFQQGSRPAFALGLTTDYAISKRLHMTVSYNARLQRYGASASQKTGWASMPYAQEPDSKMTTQSVMVGLAWSY